MSGHSKWSKVKHQKAITDSARGKIFTKMANAITIATREGESSDPNTNFKLRLAIEKARSYNMPKENIQRAIEKATHSGNADGLNSVLYEAFAPFGIGLIIEANTDNKQRTVSQIKNTLERGGGVLATRGAVSHLFEQRGKITVIGAGDDIMEEAIDKGAIDLEEAGENEIQVFTHPADLHRMKQALEDKSVAVKDASLVYHPTTSIPVSTKSEAQKILSLLDALENLDDVTNVFVNVDIPDELL